MQKLELSVFFPAYNEEANLKNTVTEAIKVLEKLTGRWEVIVVDDGSKDKTAEIADSLAKQLPNVRVIHHKQNRGYGAAFKSGVYSAKYNWITFTDSDGQFDFKEITKLIEKQKESNADLVIGYYLKRAVPFVREVNTFFWETLVFIMFGLRVHDIDCGFKLISKKVIDTIPKLESERGAFISSEFLIKAKKAGFKIVEVGVHHYPRRAGQATGASLRVIIKSFIDLARLWRQIR